VVPSGPVRYVHPLGAVLGTGQKAKIETGSNCRTFLRGLPTTPPNKHDSVVKLVMDGKPEAC